MRALFILLVALSAWLPLPASAETKPASSTPDALTVALEQGAITSEQATILRAVRILDPEQLPSQYRSAEQSLSKCATDVLAEAMTIVQNNPDEYGSYAKMFLSRPSTQWYLESTLGHFRLHFDTSGPQAVPLNDADSNGLPDYIERAANFADSSYVFEVETMAHYKPVSDGFQGGSEQYDIYFQHVPYYGYTSPETPGPNPWNDYSSHIVVHNDFAVGFPPNDDPEGNVMGALKVTIAHELYHAVQFAYDVSEASYFMEMSSTWMEEEAYPQVNDNYNYLPYFFTSTQTGLQAGDIHRYASFIWPKFLEERFGRQIMRDMWAKCQSVGAAAAWPIVIDSAGSTIESEFTRFVLWNYFTGDRNIDRHFKDASDYPQVNIMAYHNTLPDSSNFSSLAPEPYGANYIVVENLIGYQGMLIFDFTGLAPATWGVAYVIDYGNGQYTDSLMAPMPTGTGKICIPNFENALRVIFAPGVGSSFGSTFNYQYHLYFRIAGDVNNDNTTSISDAVQIINWIFAGGTPPNPVIAADVNCDGFASISDAVHLINYIFAGGPAPCDY